MSVFKKTILLLTAVFILFNITILLTGKTYFYKAVYYNFAEIDDYKIFPNRVIEKSPSPTPWPISENYNKIKLPESLQSTLEKHNSVAFLIIKNDSIIHEQYWEGYSDTSYSNSFSMAKSFVSALIGIAIKEGKIKSVDQYVSEYLPEFKEEGKNQIKIQHLLMMSSGLEWNEAYSDPLSVTTEAYYGNDLEKIIRNLEVKDKPGIEFSYKSGDTEVLSFILQKATGVSISKYAEEKLWDPMGATNNALWCLDKKGGREKAYCCLNSNARDFARLGYLYLKKGNWKGKQIIDTSYIEKSITPNGLLFKKKKCDFYGYQWWIIPEYKGQKAFYARGILGQMIIVIPDKNIVIVRLGKNRGGMKEEQFEMALEILDYLSFQ